MYIKYPDDKYTLKNNLEKLDEITKTCSAKGWNLYDADPLPNRAIHVARKFLEELGDLPQPFISPTACGYIQAEWELPNGLYLEIELKDKNGEFPIFCCGWEDDKMPFQMEGKVKTDQKSIANLIQSLVCRGMAE